MCSAPCWLAGFDFDILPTAEVGLVYFHHLRENMSERTLIVAQALVRAFGAILLFKFMFDENGYCFFGGRCGIMKK